MSAQPPDLLVVELRLPSAPLIDTGLREMTARLSRSASVHMIHAFTVDQKVKLNFGPVHLPVQIHDTTLSPAKPHAPQHMKHPYCLSHGFPPHSYLLCFLRSDSAVTQDHTAV